MRVTFTWMIVAAWGILFQAHAQTFPCDNGQRLYFFQETGGPNGSLSCITGYTTGTPQVTALFPMPTHQHNGLAANPFDNYLYYLESNKLNRLDASGNATTVCTLSNPSLFGCFDYKGRYWTIQLNALVAYDINSCTVVKGPYNLAVGTGFLDVAFNPKDCHFYIGNLRVDTNGVADPSYPGVSFVPSGTYGGVAIGSDGNIYGVDGNAAGGDLSVIDLTTFSSHPVSTIMPGPVGARSDMASFPCSNVDASFSFTTGGCASVLVNFQDLSTGPVGNWTWNFGDPQSGPSNSSSLQNPSHLFPGPGTYTVTLTVSTGSQLCYLTSWDTDTMVVQIVSGQGLSATVQQQMVSCFGLCNATASVQINGGQSPYSYLWSNGSVSSAISALCPGSYSVTVTDAAGCSSIQSMTVTQPSVLQLTTSSTPAICNLPTGSATASVTGGAAPYSFLWSNGQQTQAMTGLSAQQYSVTVADGNGCTVQSVVQVGQGGSGPQLNIGGNQTICPAQSTTLTVTGALSYLWNTGSTESAIEISPAQTSTYSVTAWTSGCSTQVALTVYVTDVFLELGESKDICGLKEIELTASASASANVQWSTGDPGASIIINSPGVYWATATLGQCQVTDSVIITGDAAGDSPLWIPNSFTPDRNGLNETFSGVGENILEYHMQIFNRWGEKIFETDHMDQPWEGTVKGRPVQEDVYVYKIRFRNLCSGVRMIEKTGHVSVIR